MKKTLIILTIAFLHFIISMAVFSVAFGMTMGRFDTGDAPGRVERVVALATNILHFPLVALLLPIFPRSVVGPLEYLPFILNSLLWGGCLSLLPSLVKAKSRKEKSQS